MASQAESDCLSNPNFAVICSFMDRYAKNLGLPEIGYKDLQEWIEDAKNVHPLLIDLHVRLLRRIHKKLSNVTADRWERGVVKFCYKYSNVDAWEIERFGYKLAKISTKLTLLKNLMESQFDCNNKFKDKVNEIALDEMRFKAVGRDKDGMAYWYFLDKELNLRVYREHQDDVDSESWELVCRNRDDLAKLITGLDYGTDIKLDKQESSDMSEPVSDLNEDSRESFKQKTPLGPSPLTIKQEPGESDTADTKQPIVLKISKAATQSPSKMLKDKFVKEKGSEIQRIMCKMKEEGLVDSENGDDVERLKEKNEERDEVDGSGDSKDDQCNQTEGSNDDKDKLKCEIINKDGETDVVLNDSSNKKDIKEEIRDGKENDEEINCSKEEGKEIEISGTVTHEIDVIENEIIGVKSKVEKKNVKENNSEKEALNTIQGKRDDEKGILNETQKNQDNDAQDVCSANTMTSLENDNVKENETNEVKIISKLGSADEKNKNGKNCLENAKENDEIEMEKASKACEPETDKNKFESPQTNKLSETENLNSTEKAAMNIRSESPSNKNDTVEMVENAGLKKECSENVSDNLKEGSPKLSDQKSYASEVNTAEKLVEDNNDKDVICDEEVKEKEYDKAEKTADITCKEKEDESIKTCDASSTKEGIAESLPNQPIEMGASSKQDNSENSRDIEKSSGTIENEESKQVEQSIETVKQNNVEDLSAKKDREIVSPEKDTEIQSLENDTEIKSTEIKSTEEDTEIKSSEEDKDIKSPKESTEIKPPENDTENRSLDLGSKNKPLAKDTESKYPEECIESKPLEKGTDVKKARKRKKGETKTEIGSSSTDEEIDNESKQPCKRPVKSAVRKSPKKQAEETEAIAVEEENGRITADKSVGDKHEMESDRVVKEVTETKCEVSEKSEGENDTETETKEEKEPKEFNEIVKDTSEMEEKADSDKELGPKSPTKVTGLLAHSKRSKSKAQKRQAENSDDMEPAEPASKRSKLRSRVSSRGRGKRRGVTFDSSSSDDDIPLSQVAGRGRGSNSRGRAGKVVGKQQKEVIKDPPKKKKVETEQKRVNNTEEPEIPSDLSEEDTGRRRSARVRNMRARKKSPSPDYLPSELEESEDDFYDEDDDEFKLKSKKRKKREPREVVEEVPKGRNALRHEAKANKKGTKVVVEEEEEEEAACVKCLRSHQPEWILLCDKCDAGYHTACLRPPLMIIPDGDWFCPPCEHTSLKEKLEENLKNLDQAILKNDRLVRRKERLAFVSVSLDNVLKEPEPGEVIKERHRKKPNYKDNEDESESGTSSETRSSESTSESESSSEGESSRTKKSKPKYIQRACRTKKSVSYRFEEFDELIMDAIEEDLSIPKEPKPRKVKPPGISRGKDMSNILGASDEEAPTKPVRKRKPRLTELDEDLDDDDDTDDYQLSDASNASDATKSSNYESEGVSEDSIESSWRYNSRSTRRSRRKGGRNRKYKDDFVVDSDFESDEDSKRRSKRRSRRSKVNYREINSDETEVEDNDGSFHSSELSDSDFEVKRKNRNERKAASKERPRSGKRQRIRKVVSSSESSEEDSDDSSSRKQKGKKPPSKSARYDSDETDGGSEKVKARKSKTKKFQEVSDMSETEAEFTEDPDSSETEVSESDTNKTSRRKKNVKNILKSDSEEEDEEGENINVKKRVLNESHDTHSSKESEESGWEEIGVDTDNENVADYQDKDIVEKGSETVAQKGKQPNTSTVGTSRSPQKVMKQQPEDSEVGDKMESADTKPESLNVEINKSDEHKLESDATEMKEENEKAVAIEKDNYTPEVTPQKKKRGRKSKSESLTEDSATTTPEVTPKKRGRKPKAKPEASETNVDEAPIKKKRGRKPKSKTGAEVACEKGEHVGDKVETDSSVIVENKTGNVSEIKIEGSDKNEESHKPEEQTTDEKNETEVSQTVEKGKDDSPLSARNKQNAPVGVVKPEVRQGVIVENKQVIDGRLNESRAGENVVNPLQGMRDLAMGNQDMQGSHQSSFTPYSQSNYQGQNMPGYMGQQGFQAYPHQAPSYGQGGPGPNHPYQGPQGMPPGAPPQYPANQGPMSPNSYQQHGPFMGPMQQGPPGYFPGNYRPQVGHQEGFGPPNPHGPNPQYYHPHQGPYQGQRHAYPEHPGPYHMGHQGPMPHPQSQQGPGPYPGMPYNYPNMPQQGLHRPGFGPAGPQQSMSPNQPVRPQTRLAGPPVAMQGSSPNPRTETEVSNRGFMMDNILKPSSEAPSNDVEDSAEVSDIDRYTSFLCKTE